MKGNPPSSETVHPPSALIVKKFSLTSSLNFCCFLQFSPVVPGSFLFGQNILDSPQEPFLLTTKDAVSGLLMLLCAFLKGLTELDWCLAMCNPIVLCLPYQSLELTAITVLQGF